jgi:hypothetical protein
MSEPDIANPTNDVVTQMLASRHVRCPQCKYDLYQSQEPVCAECGLRLTEVVLVDAIAMSRRMTKTLHIKSLQREWSSYRRMRDMAFAQLMFAGVFIGGVRSFDSFQHQTLQRSGALQLICIPTLALSVALGASTLTMYFLRVRVRKRSRTLISYANCLMIFVLFAAAFLMFGVVDGFQI